MDTSILSTIQALAPIIIAVVTTAGGAYGYFYYKSTKPKSVAEAQKLNAEVVVTFADGWQKYAEKLEKRMDDLENLIEAKDKAHKEALDVKDEEIRVLKGRVLDLETELNKYKTMGAKMEEAKSTIHEAVDSSIDQAKTL